jgi:hypothetical protein
MKVKDRDHEKTQNSPGALHHPFIAAFYWLFGLQ